MTAPRHADGVSWVALDNEVVVLQPEEMRFNLLNATAALVWQLLDGETTLDELVADLADAFQASVDAVAGDVDLLVADLTERGLLVPG